MFLEAIGIVRRNLLFYIYAVALVTATLFVDHYHPNASNQISGIIWIWLALWVQSSILDGRQLTERGLDSYSPAKSFYFFGKNFIIIILSVIPVLLFTVYYRAFNAQMTGLLVLYDVVIGAVMTSLLLAFIGTWLPAGLYGHATSLPSAIKRGTRSFAKTFARMLAGSALPAICNSLVVALMIVAGNSLDVIVNGRVNLIYLTISIMLISLQAVSVTYVSVVLARQYMRSEELPDKRALVSATA